MMPVLFLNMNEDFLDHKTYFIHIMNNLIEFNQISHTYLAGKTVLFFLDKIMQKADPLRAVGRSENPGVPVVIR